ncbi:hypothetical protein Q0Z83_060470 [Actinoplanes sichuanensis]|uniref:DeoxyPurine in DNA protein A domain-containing protein n=1 Tax=Actinoplanes sichuanensis TaxID=512349 RepID=A0ABW4A6K1_9ACTN|nr:hypothetical protein [Actinoplanes sichuanensis]BEL07856.1 hypothetical protein Q0Z83_060470 [Actinoplanes sichuanensis]
MTVETFYLGTHETSWLGAAQMPTDACLFVSHRRLNERRSLPSARVNWALDSGGFTELQMYGEWRTTPQQYVAAVRRYDAEIGRLEWAAPQDWMCEPIVISGGKAGPVTFAGTKLSVEEHQRRTVDNFIQLSELWGDDFTNPFMPVLQGYERDDYLRCWDRYDAAGISLGNYPVVGLGSVCRRQAEDEIGDIVTTLLALDEGLPVHGFGVKLRGLEKYGHLLNTADSMAWSYDARYAAPLPECVEDPAVRHKNCANCIRYALRWRRNVLGLLAKGGAK